MKISVRYSILCFVVMLGPRAHSQKQHPFTVADDIEMVRFSESRSHVNAPGSNGANMSPDGKYVAVVTTKGLLESDLIESQLSVFETKELKTYLDSPGGSAPQPRVLAKIVSFPHGEQSMPYAAVIKDVRWLPDSTELVFKAERPRGFFQLCAAALNNSGVSTLSSEGDDVDQFDISKDTIVYTASHSGDVLDTDAKAINADARVATGSLLYELLFPGELARGVPKIWSLSVLRSSHGTWDGKRVPLFQMRARSFLSNLIPFKLSPDRNKLITLTPALSIPVSWERYDPASGYEHLRLHSGDSSELNPLNPDTPRRFSLIDLVTGKETPLLDAPDGRSLGYLEQRRVVWSLDGKRALITNAFFALGDPHQPNSQLTKPCAVASVDLPSLTSRCVFFEEPATPPNSLQEVSFGRDNDQLLITLKKGATQQDIREYKFQDASWTLKSSASADNHNRVVPRLNNIQSGKADTLRVVVKQSLNESPTLWAEDDGTGKAKQLWDPNPQFTHMRFAPASPYRWTDKTGYEWTAELVQPLDYVPGNKYPLVLQMYTFNEGQFLTDGLYPTAFAARQLADAGFFVLQIKKKADTLSEKDPQDHLEGYRSAIEKLAKDGLIDPRRVGVIGFSWTCWYAVNALIREPDMFAAATIADGLDNSYMQYLLFAVDAPGLQKQMERIRGGSPFGEGLKRWVDQSPGFHLDRVRTPLRIEAINPTSVLQEWELYSSLRLQHKPVDLIYFPEGTHIHQKPLERLESQQGDVDWFRFWLQDYEDPAPSKRGQYERWRELKRHIGENSPTAALQ